MESTYNAHHHEKAAQALWESHDVYAAVHNSGPLYSIDTPPPTVSGSLHIGHVFSYTQADIIARYKRMSGFSVFYPIGFDDNGLATERFVEKTRGVSPFKLGRSAFIDVCLQVTQEMEKKFEELWRRLGLSFDWKAQYSTISPLVRKISQESFIELYKKGFVYRREEVAPYCPACRTSVAQAELDDAEKPSTFNEVVFTTLAGQELVIATTRPELLSSCVALLYNPNDPRYQQLQGKTAVVPLFGTEVPVLADETVLMDKGTGLVMCCTFGDKTDVAWFKKFSLPYRPSLGRDGRMLEHTGVMAGKKVAEAREVIIAALKEAGVLRAQRAISHVVNVHERCKNDVEFLALEQWFLKILPYKEQFLALADQIEWNPPFMKARYVDWVQNLSWDWCLSRQRFYGIPFPVWHCVQCQAVVFADATELPVDPQEMVHGKSCPQCKGTDIVPDTDVMDTWNTSSLTPYICKALYRGDTIDFVPMGMRPQAHDIIRTWAFDTIVKTWMHDSTIPWKTIIISGHVLSGQGGKISKSQGNSPWEPENLLKAYPADAIRYWTASASLGHDVAFSENQLKIGNKLLIKLWNAFRFIKEHQGAVVEPESLGLLNEWILHQITDAARLYHYYFETYELGLALGAVERFFWHDFCDNYLELCKDQLFNPHQYTTDEVAATQWTLMQVGVRLLQLFAPYMPHVTEVLYQEIKASQDAASRALRHPELVSGSLALSLHQMRFAELQKPYEFPRAKEFMQHILTLVVVVRKLKSDQQLSLKTDIAILTVAAPAALLQELAAHEKVFKSVTRAQQVAYQPLHDQYTELRSMNDQYEATIVIDVP